MVLWFSKYLEWQAFAAKDDDSDICIPLSEYIGSSSITTSQFQLPANVDPRKQLMGPSYTAWDLDWAPGFWFDLSLALAAAGIWGMKQ